MDPELSPRRALAPASELFPTWLKLHTRNRDTDQFGHVNHAAMATLFEESRIALIFAPEFASETRRIDLLVANLRMTFYKELRAPGVVQVGALVTRMGSSSLDIRQAIFVDETCYASADAVCVLFGSETRRPVKASETLRSMLMPAG
ncbi:MAG TPA: hotdog domain-containing protein [Novosphingobium sp.]|nr:hotdog domain-containing protein [Novosphingobium sp.]